MTRSTRDRRQRSSRPTRTRFEFSPSCRHLALVGNGYSYIRRYASEFLDAFEFRASPASEDLLRAIHLLHDLNPKNARSVPRDVPAG